MQVQSLNLAHSQKLRGVINLIQALITNSLNAIFFHVLRLGEDVAIAIFSERLWHSIFARPLLPLVTASF